MKRHRFNRPNRKENRAKDPLGEYFVWWDEIEMDHIRRYEECLVSAKREQDLQAFFESAPMVLIQHLGGGHGRWVIPRARLGAEHQTDFLIGEKSSLGYEWYAVELESPRAQMFTKSGDPRRQLTHAIGQIQDWRAWLIRNQNYAARAKAEKGLGLIDISPNLPGLILIGRRTSIDPETNERRKQMCNEHNISIHSYDFIIDSAKGRVGWTKNKRMRRLAGN